MQESKNISKGINIITLCTSVRWFGWGLGEAFLPIFLLLFSANFLKLGILSSIYNVIFLISIPIAGFLAYNINVNKMISIGLVIYVFIGLGYFLAGLTGLVVFVIIARGLNGVSYSLDQVGREYYFLKYVPIKKISKTFGHFDFITNTSWALAVLIGLILVKFMNVPIHWLLVFIVPTSIISLFIISHLKETPKPKNEAPIYKIYLRIFSEIKKFSRGLKTIAFLTILSGSLSSIIYFFLPAIAYLNGDGLVKSSILALVYVLPQFLGNFLGSIASNKKEKIYPVSLLSLIAVFLVLIISKNYLIMLLSVFTASTIFELMSLTNKRFIAQLSERTHLGEVDGSLNGLSAIGSIAGPLFFGLLMDLIGVNRTYLILIVIIMISSFFILRGLKYLERKH